MLVISLRGVRRRWAAVLAAVLALAYLPWVFHHLTPSHHPQGQGVVSRIPAAGRQLVLAFVDGPHGRALASVVRDLTQAHDQATFFVVGLNAGRDAPTLRRAVALGDDVESHTEGHINLTSHTYQQDLNDLTRAQRSIEQASGVRPRFVFPPYGAVNPTVLSAAARLHLTVVLPPLADRIDAASQGPDTFIHQVLQQASSGAVLIIHPGHERRFAQRTLPVLLGLLRAKGYHVTSIRALASEVRAGTFGKIGRVPSKSR